MKGYALLPLLVPVGLSAQITTLDGLLPSPDAQQWTPVTQRDRFNYYVKTTFSLGELGGSGLSAAIRQYFNQPPEWHQGAAGFSHRFGDSLAKSGVRLTVRYGVAAALKEDNRYIAASSTTTRGRLWYAIASTYAARDERGHRRFAISKLAGNVSGTVIGRSWEPPSWQSSGRAATDFAFTSILQMSYNIAAEFTPDVLKRLRR